MLFSALGQLELHAQSGHGPPLPHPGATRLAVCLAGFLVRGRSSTWIGGGDPGSGTS